MLRIFGQFSTMPLRFNFFLILILARFSGLHAQNNFPQIKIRQTSESMILDGVFNEKSWAMADPVQDFQMCYPSDTLCTKWQTEVRMLFDNEKLYLAIRCHQNQNDYIIQSLKRDFNAGSSDVINILFDPYRDGLNGFIFSVTPFNVQREGTIIEGADMSLVWDNKWNSKVTNYKDHWDIEISIPFKSLRYKLSPEGKTNHWGINFIRTKVRDFEVNTWSPVPSIYNPVSLAFVGDLIWLDAPPNPGKNIALIPYFNLGYAQEKIRNSKQQPIDQNSLFTKSIGADAKVAITPGLNLDLTINPDFSQVEVDAQIANVSRFEIFYPETRQFFIENQDLFGRFGFPSTRPFFSRRIGLARNPITSENNKVSILAGARLSGKINNAFRLGLMSMYTKQKTFDSIHILPASSLNLLVLQHKIFSRSVISAIYVDKENVLQNIDKNNLFSLQSYNRVAGLEFNLFSKDNKWEGESYFHHSFSPISSQNGNSYASFLSYAVKSFKVRAGHVAVDSFYYAEAGFVPRVGIKQLISGFEYSFWPIKNLNIRRYILGFSADNTFNTDWNKLDYLINPFVGIEFKEQSFIGIGITNSYTYLYNDFDPTGGLRQDGEINLPVGKYFADGFKLESYTGTTYKFQASLNINAGKYYEGKRLNIKTSLLYRIQPIGTLSLTLDYNNVTQNKPFPSATFYVLGTKADIAFRKDLFLSTFLQYNTQINNFNINTRLQWRYAPVSDIFLVYTDNSFAQTIDPNIRFFSLKNRAVVLKAVYWLNL